MSQTGDDSILSAGVETVVVVRSHSSANLREEMRRVGRDINSDVSRLELMVRWDATCNEFYLVAVYTTHNDTVIYIYIILYMYMYVCVHVCIEHLI